ncbi:MAG TPA: hypothetical protein VLF18_21150 [Tahibacter sp.]|uniref:hypothetical protein n=1 Tax=Tahibacter sp. TaxID=2056211 RepID=UPI002C42080A|nr:hypothetical protein [Tahibacter sp.]HSX62697.1 hypothetical protein [Tahibacter sp.]
MMPNATDAIPLLAALLAQPAERQRLIARYLRGDMDAGMLAAFEERLLDDAGLLDEVETEKVLRQGLRESPQALAATTTHRWQLPLSIAASGLFGALLTYALMSAPPAAPGAQRIAVAQLPATRGDAIPADAEITLDASARQIVLRVPATNEAGPFRLRIRDGATLLGSFDDLKPDDSGQFDVLVALPTPATTRLTLDLEAWRDGSWRQRPTRTLQLRRP